MSLLHVLPKESEPLRYAKCTDCGGARKMQAGCFRHSYDCSCKTPLVDCERCDGSGSEPCGFCGTDPALADAFGTICAECLRNSETDQELELAFSVAQEVDAGRDVAAFVDRAKAEALKVSFYRPGDEKTAAIGALEFALKEALLAARRAGAHLENGQARLAHIQLQHVGGLFRGR